ncbi:MAG: Panacea domain-containing protein [Pseudolabrys sp.]
MQFDHDKFKALLHYIVWKAGDRDGFGATKLYKILWFSDARAYMLHKEAITSERYIREKYGPLPTHALSVIQELTNDGAIRVSTDDYYGKPIRHFHSLRVPDKLALNSEQRGIVDYWIKHIADEHTAASISEQSHDYAWEIAKLGEEIPYHAIFATRIRDPEGAEIEWATRKAKELGLP